MTEKEIEDRNFFIRFRLRGKAEWALSDEQIEQVRLYQMGDIWIIEDENLMTFVAGKEEKEIAPVQEGDRRIPANLAADGYHYCGSFAEETENNVIPFRGKSFGGKSFGGK